MNTKRIDAVVEEFRKQFWDGSKGKGVRTFFLNKDFPNDSKVATMKNLEGFLRETLLSFSQELLAEKREEIRAKKEVVDKDNPLMGLTDQYHQNGWNAALDEALTILGEK